MVNKLKIPRRARYDFATKRAYDFLEENSIYALPLDPFQICDLMDVTLNTYSEIASQNQIPVSEVSRLLQSPDGVAIYADGCFSIFYNDTYESLGRIRFTIFHELGHIYLNHLVDFEETTLSRNGLSNKDYKVLENEANCFARNVLAPLPVILSQETLHPLFVEEICDVSPQAAVTRLNFIKSDFFYLTKQSYEYMNSRFSKFIFHVNNTYLCVHCGSITSAKTPYCCRICGNSDLVKSKYSQGVEDSMMYSGIKLNENFRPYGCPTCKTENFMQGNYCHICGLYMYNKCTGLYPGESDYYEQKINWHSHTKGCNIALPGDARFCTQCGSTSTFSEDNLLPDWNTEKARRENDEDLVEENLYETLDLPF